MSGMLLTGDAAEVISWTDFKPVLDAITAQISVGTVVAVVGATIAASVGFVFMWWGVRKAKSAIQKAAFKGRM